MVQIKRLAGDLARDKGAKYTHCYCYLAADLRSRVARREEGVRERRPRFTVRQGVVAGGGRVPHPEEIQFKEKGPGVSEFQELQWGPQSSFLPPFLKWEGCVNQPK